MSPEDLLRRASSILRKSAEKATPGPWREEYSKPSGFCVLDSESRNCLDSVARTMHYRAAFDSAYIALMHPGVGALLADWLDQEADAIADWDPDTGDLEDYLAHSAAPSLASAIVEGR